MKKLGLLVLGYFRVLWWNVISSEAAQRRRIQRLEIKWCGKPLTEAELDEWIEDSWWPRWRRGRTSR